MKDRGNGPSGPKLWNNMERAFDQVCAAYNARKLMPLVEADISGYLYHVLATQSGGDVRLIHLDTRVLGAAGNEKYDLVIGGVVGTEDLRRLVENIRGKLDEVKEKQVPSRFEVEKLRPMIWPDLVLEIKLFAI